MIRWRKRIRRLTYALTDVLSVFVSYIIVTQIFIIVSPERVTFSFLEAMGFISMISFFHIFTYMVFSIYEGTIENYGRLTPKLASEMGFAFAVVALFMGAAMFYMHASLSRLFLGAFMVSFYFLIMVNRGLLRHFSFKNIEKSLSVRNILVVGQSTRGLQYIREIEKYSYLNLRIAGYIHIKEPNTYDNIPHLGGLEELEEIVRDYVIDEIAVARPLSYDYRLFDLLDHCQQMGVTVSMLLETRNNHDTKAQVAMVGELPVLKFHSVSLDEDQIFWKRALDICGATIGFILFAIAYIIVGPMIKLESEGPIIFKQKRVGKNGRVFKIWKFRSMGVDAEAKKAALMTNNEMSGNMFKMTNDPRVTKIGAFIRKTSIDELPQFVNVLKGDMSLVGTRPPTVDEVEHYQRHHHRRISITPGITGKWQISGRSDIQDFEEIVKLDSEYISEWSIWEDIKILFKTVGVVLKRRGSK